MYDIQVFEVKTLEALIDIFYFGVSAKKSQIFACFYYVHALSFIFSTV